MGAVICDHSEEYTQIAEKRLNVRRLDLADEIKAALTAQPMAGPPLWPGVEPTTRYALRPDSTDLAKANQMALFEKYDGGGNGAGKASKAAAKKPRPKSRS